LNEFADPLRLAEVLWPDVCFYSKQRDIIYSVRDDKETVVHAGNMLGKDFVAAFIVLWFFLSRTPCRIVTTSVDGHQLEGVLWGEMRRFIQNSRYPLDYRRSGPLVINHLHLRKIVNGEQDGLSYAIGRVAAKGEGLQGHHIAKTGDGIPRTLFVGDEASALDDADYNAADTWADRKLIIGNPLPCNNFFRLKVREGTQAVVGNGHLRQNVIRIRAEDSPNVQRGLAEAAAGAANPGRRMLIPGVLGYEDYVNRRATWDAVRQCIGLDGLFYEGAEVLMFPPDWLNKAEEVGRNSRRGGRLAMGLDTAEGGDSTSWVVVDDYGLVSLRSRKTPDTSKIPGETIALINEYGVPPECVMIDAGGGGKEHADRMRSMGYAVRTVSFGGAATARKRRGAKSVHQRELEDERRYAYRNRRAELYGVLRLRLDPARQAQYDLPAFGLPPEVINRKRMDGRASLREQLAPIPLTYDDEGRMIIPPKRKRARRDGREDTTITLTDLIGCSPDEADALALAVFGLHDAAYRPTVTVA